MFDDYTRLELLWIGLSVFLLGMGKGGLPVGAIVLPLLLLVWPDKRPDAARDAVGFMLPILCTMDVIAITLYRKHIEWRRILALVPGSVIGVGLGSLLFVNEVRVSDDALKCGVGVIGILFVLYQATSSLIARKVEQSHAVENRSFANTCGVAAGFVSTLAHAAGPVARIYFLTQRMEKMAFAATFAAFFFFLNAFKLIPFAALDMLHVENLALAGALSPLIPVGVGLGYLIVKHMKTKAYFTFIYAVLFLTSVTLIIKSWPGA